MATLDLFTLIFQEILKISPNILYKYTTLQDQLFNLIFLPHVVLFLFLFGFGAMIVPHGAPEGKNKGLRYLVIATTYIFIVYQGWYGTFLIPLLQTWFTIVLIFGLVLFLTVKIIHPFTVRSVGSVAGTEIVKSVGKQLGKGKELEALQKERDDTRKQLNIEKGRLARAANQWEEAQIRLNIRTLEDKEKALKREIDKY